MPLEVLEISARNRISSVFGMPGVISRTSCGLRWPRSGIISKNLPSYVLQRKRSQLVNFEERRRSLAVTQSHTHYVNALRWAIEFSTNETDLIGIIQAVPDFVKSLAEEQRRNQRYADVGNRLYLAQSLLWRTGIKRHILRLLGDCVDRKAIKTQMRGVAQSCFEALHWLTRCPATFFGDQDTSHPRVLLQPSLLDSEYQNPHIDFTIDPPDDNALLWRCTLSSLVLDQIYQTEKSLWGFTMKASPTGLQEARVMLNNADQIASLLRWSSFPAKDSGSKVLLIELLDAIPSLLPEEQSAGGIRIHTLKNFQQFRERWVLWVLKHAMGPIFSDLSMPSPQYLLVLNNLYDAATHLQWFPNSTIRSQLTVFELLDNVIHWQEWLNGRSLTSNRISEALLSSYVSVIFGPGFHEQLHSHSREEIHASFIKSVQVQGGNSRVRGRQRGTSFRDIHIQFRHYSIIITRLVSSLQRIDSEWPESHIAVRYADAFASMIGGIIQCRLAENARHQKKDIEVGMDHIKETRILRKLLRHRSDATSAAIVEMLDDTSNKLGYRIVDVEAVAEHPEGRDVQSLALTPRLIYHPKITGTHGQSRNGQTTNHQPHEERGVLPHALPQVGEDVQSIIVEPLSPAMSENSLLSLPIPPDIEEGSPKVIPHIEDVETAQQHSISDAASDSDEFDESFLRTTQIPNRPDTAGAKERPTDAHPFRDGKTPPYASILLAVEREIEEFADLDITLGDDESLEHPQESDDMEFDKPSDSTVIQSDSSGSLSPTANRVLPRSEVTGTMGTPDGSTTSLESISSIASSSTLLSPTVIGTETEKVGKIGSHTAKLTLMCLKDQINFECISKREEGDD
ncbi:hypothetical protein BD410DRAFT_508211 [Rickenella mellea]|uniref:Uncharacterized protein n=1 Tax=Rickenella mellea TaxID=50990 RepID=A0A4Y7PT16_9AGAM|nr:hypothetical protein BD410DRAFT_508211 [Rickenella mellea]